MAKKTLTITQRVRKALIQRPQTSAEIAIKIGLVGDDGEPSNYHKSQVRKGLAELMEADEAVREGNFRTAKYRRA